MHEELLNFMPENQKLTPSSIIIGIGVSVERLDALFDYFKAVKPLHSLSYIVVQTPSVKHKGFPASLMEKYLSLNVEMAEQGSAIMANTVYLSPPEHYVEILENKTIKLTPYAIIENNHFPINVLLKSLAKTQKEKAIAIVLPGKERDGFEGLKIVHQYNGFSIVQDAAGASMYSFGNVFAAPENIAGYINQMHESMDDYDSFSEGAIDQILYKIQNQNGVDFSMYKKKSILRRIERRMKLLGHPLETLDEYMIFILDHPEELQRLHDDLLNGITHFFRDEEFFYQLRKTYIPKIIENNIKKDKQTCRIWIAGCSTGEEAYSYAILFSEELEKRKLDMDLQIFATDINRRSIQKASKGCYTENEVSSIPSEWLKKYFDKTGQRYSVKKILRNHIIFAPHNLIRDTPFVNLDFISCRNVMIYFQRKLQEKVLSLFHFSLCDGGLLVLGPSETIGNQSEVYQPVDWKWKIFKNSFYDQKVKRNRFHINTLEAGKALANTFENIDERKNLQLDELYLSLIDQFLNPFLIINDQEEIIASSPNASQFLKTPDGSPSNSIYSRLSADLSVPISSALKKIKDHKSEIRRNHIKVTINGAPVFVEITVRRFKFNVRHYPLYVLFIHKELEGIKTNKKEFLMLDQEIYPNHCIQKLEMLINETNSKLQTTIEELKISNDELRSTNEKLIADNEELQTANEELQVVNEDLMTVNGNFEKKIEELSSTAGEMEKMLINSNIATVFLDNEYNIKLFTSEAANVFHLIDRDVGRPIYHIASRLNYREFLDDAKKALNEMKTIQKEVEADNKDIYIVKMIPNLSNGTKADGLVILLVNITDLKATNKALQVGSHRIEHSNSSIVVASPSGRIKYVNMNFCSILGKEQFEIIGQNIFDIYQNSFKVNEFKDHWDHVLKHKSWTGEEYSQGRNGTDLWEKVSFITLEDNEGNIQQIMRVAEDITHQKNSEKMLMKSEMLSAIGQLAAGIAHEIRNPLTSLKGFLQLMIQSNTYHKEYAEVMQSEFIRLESIINEFLFLSKTKSSKFETICVNDIIEDVYLILEAQAMLKGVRITKALCQDVNEVRAVPSELKQVFLNILKNAIEAMEELEGEILIQSKGEEDRVLIMIKDQGKGISKDFLDKLGEPFYTTKEKGTGLGLMVTMRIIESHKGEIIFESEEDQGTTVKIYLPCL
ncbi:CheR family methyltransferase [Bacillus gobiensis]|uniref:CheR family methyltransferase n=1 Tax=Bacillus gobiensis TaxID=1441095 RepID=UPI003D1E4E11